VKNTIITNKCFIDIAMSFFHKEVLKKLKADHIRHLSMTHFLHLFLFLDVLKLIMQLYIICCYYGKIRNNASLLKSLICISILKKSLIMCLPLKGTPIVYRKIMVTDFTLRLRHFRYNQEFSRQ
jgi:hypothetical protein